MSAGSQKTVGGRVGLGPALSRSALRLQSDGRLVSLTRSGSDAAFAVIVERYRDPLLRYCRRLIGPDEAEDAVQQAFTNALTALRADERAVALRPWLFRISHNLAINSLNRSGRYYEQLDDQYDGVRQPPDLVDQKLRIETLVEAIDRLPERQRAAMLARELEGRSYEEIALRMHEPTPAVRQLIHRARTRLRDACGLLVPVWALRWMLFAQLRTPDGAQRVGEAVAGGTTGAGLVKAGTVLLATGALATGAGGLVTGKGLPVRAPKQPAAAHADVVADGAGSVAASGAPGQNRSPAHDTSEPVGSGRADRGDRGGEPQRGRGARPHGPRPDRAEGELHGNDAGDPARSATRGPGNGQETLSGDDGGQGSHEGAGGGGEGSGGGAQSSGPGSSDHPSGQPDSKSGPGSLPPDSGDDGHSGGSLEP